MWFLFRRIFQGIFIISVNAWKHVAWLFWGLAMHPGRALVRIVRRVWVIIGMYIVFRIMIQCIALWQIIFSITDVLILWKARMNTGWSWMHVSAVILISVPVRSWKWWLTWIINQGWRLLMNGQAFLRPAGRFRRRCRKRRFSQKMWVIRSLSNRIKALVR